MIYQTIMSIPAAQISIVYRFCIRPRASMASILSLIEISPPGIFPPPSHKLQVMWAEVRDKSTSRIISVGNDILGVLMVVL